MKTACVEFATLSLVALVFGACGGGSGEAVDREEAMADLDSPSADFSEPLTEESLAQASQAELLERVLQELPTAGDEELLAVRADLESDLEALRAAEMRIEGVAEVGTLQQALTDSDGCTTDRWHDAPVPFADITLGIVFKHSSSVFDNQCAWHDHCYSSGKGTYGFSRSDCDSSWLSKMESRCNSKYPWYVRYTVAGSAVWRLCNATALSMYTAVRAAAEPNFMSTPCIGGQIWPSSGWNGTCSTYEPFDSRAPICTGVSAGERSDGTVGPNWSGCRGTGCSACTDLLTEFPRYFQNNPNCVANTACGGQVYLCGSACPAPDWQDR